jgi:NADPH-dependent 2,4-dienoyl-CoA reductase/sulfur reductase-like enzyme
MGVCTECTMRVDGRPGVLACLTAARDGMDIDLQPATPALAEDGSHDLPEYELTPDVLVVGGGPAGLTAAIAAAHAGLDVVLVDERSKLGGQYFKQPAAEFDVDEHALDDQYRQGRALIEQLQASSVRVLQGVTVWGAFSPDRLHAAGRDARWVLRPRRLILATGAYERGVPMPGWTLPGVVSTGAAQSLLRSSQVSPGARMLVSGNGPLNMQVAAEMARAGVKVVALAELADIRRPSNSIRSARMLAATPALARVGVGYLATLARARVPMLSRSAVIRLEGEASVASATVARIDAEGRPIAGTERRFDVDGVCVGFGFLPSNEIARSLDCRHRFDEQRGGLVVECDETGRTSLPNVWVIGDSAAIAGAKVAAVIGVLAGHAVAVDLGATVSPTLAERVRRARRALVRHRRFQDALWQVYDAPTLYDQLAEPNTVICRCENVSLRQIEAAMSSALHSAGALKRVTRVGMGKCQGRYCGPVVTALAARRSGQPVDEVAGFFAQVPYKPTEVATMAAPEGR